MGSSPTGGTHTDFASGYRKTWLIRLLREQETAGSNPATPTVSSSTLDGSSRNHGVCGEVVNASDCDSDIRGFESRQTPHKRDVGSLQSPVTQLAECQAVNRNVTGSSPVRGATLQWWVEAHVRVMLGRLYTETPSTVEGN